jgi:minor histocompatibility antigen H13
MWALPQVIEVPYVINLLILVTSILYVGCHASLILREEQALARGEKHPDHPEGRDDVPIPLGETMRKEDAMQFPLMGSASLFSLYLAFKYLDKDMVNLLISIYFVSIGCLALTMTAAPCLQILLPVGFSVMRINKDLKIPHPFPKSWAGESPWVVSVELSATEIVAGMGSCVFSYFYFTTKHWALNNVLGICFCFQGIERFSLGTYKIGAILLVGLFFYDIFWV